MQPSTAEACGAPAPVPSTARAARGHPAGSPYGAWSSDNSRSPGTPAVRSSRGLTPDARPLAAFRRALPLFSKEVLQRCIIQHRIGQQPLQTSVLVLEPFKALGLADIHTAISGFPFVDCRIADAVPAAQISDGNPGLVLLQNADDLIFSEPAALHLWSYRLGQSLPQNWMRRRGNVTADAPEAVPPRYTMAVPGVERTDRRSRYRSRGGICSSRSGRTRSSPSRLKSIVPPGWHREPCPRPDRPSGNGVCGVCRAGGPAIRLYQSSAGINI